MTPPPDPVKPLNAWQPERDPVRVAVLGKLLEELAELSAITSRVLIQGIDEFEPVSGASNRKWLTDEVGDVLGLIRILRGEFNLDNNEIGAVELAKIQHVWRWLDLLRRPSSSPPV